ncbi:hypothetical protein VKT23_008856 [Stygiomarasmius scandens]|uniref:ATP synthase F0 subunit 8 n=1 Tax=Marasmiellus scandens TaxID=2682957 RepID=A0ABR1JFR9_9AGAR
MHLPCNPVEFNLIGFSPKLPLCSPLLLWFVAAFGVVLVIRFAFGRSRTLPVNVEKEKQASRDVEKKSVSWRIFGLDSLPVSLPITLTAPTNTMVGKGVGLNAGSVLSRSLPSQLTQQPRSPSPPRRGGPTFEQPMASIYQSQEPISMAKIIMSRHTFRRPTPKPSRRATSLPPSRPQSMV